MICSGTKDELEAFGQKSFMRLKKGEKRSGSGVHIRTGKNKQNKLQNFDTVNESPYAQGLNLSKQRSSFNFRTKPAQKSTSTPLYVSDLIITPSLKNNSQLSNSSQKDFIPNLRSKLLPQTMKSTKNSSKLIEDKLIETLKNIKSKQIETHQFEAYQIAFADIIERDSVYGSLLKKIKEAYEQKIKYEKIDVSKEVIEKLKADLKELNEKLLEKKKEKKILVKKIEKFVKENVEIGRKLTEWEERYFDIHDKFVELSKIDIGTMRMDELSWKFLITENKHLEKLCIEMRKDVKMLSKKERKLVKLMVILKDRGYPVEEVFQEEMEKKEKKMKDWENELRADEPLADNSENEDLVSGRPKNMKKPEIVPCLDFNELIESQEDFESSESTESEQDI